EGNDFVPLLSANSHIEIEGKGMDRTYVIQDDENLEGLFKPEVNSEKLPNTYFSLSFKDLRMLGNDYRGTSVIFSNETYPLRFWFNRVAFNKFEYGYYYERELGQGYAFFTDCLIGDNECGVLVG